MAVDIEQLHEIHRVESEVDAAERYTKELRQKRVELICDLPEYKTLRDLQVALKQAEAKLRVAVRFNKDLNTLEVERGEAAFHLRDLREILSHHLIAYHDQTGLSVVKDRAAVSRQIQFRARLASPVVANQLRSSLGLDRHLGVNVEIPAPPPAQHLAEAA
jgi:DNA integrity scanning protein DisA with diadenylate cyclase activity